MDPSGVIVLLALAGGPDPRTILEQSMRRVFPSNIVAVIQQHDPMGDGASLTVKVERARDGRVRFSVLQPLRMQGIESVDDTRLSRVFQPDQHVVVEQDSPQLQPCDAARRADLAVRNYRVTVEGVETIAGRRAYRVVARPQHPGMEGRRFLIDEQTSYPMHIEAVSQSGVRTVLLTTKSIAMPAAIDARLFELRPPPGTQVVRYGRPLSLPDANAAQQKMGFRPLMPRDLPLGFQVTDMQVSDGPRWRSLVFRLTDGLVSATLYQWKAGPKRTIEAVEGRTNREVGEVHLMLVSEIPAAMRERLLDAFRR